MKVHQGRVARKIVIRSINAKVRIGNGGTRHIQRINYLLKVRGRAIGGDLVSKNGGRFEWGKKSKNALHI